MKKNIKILLILMSLSFLAYSCSSVESSKEEYFGFNNNPKVTQGRNSDDYAKAGRNETKKWVNPLSDEFDERIDGYVEHNLSYRYFSPRPHFVTVVVPWWDYYYGWGPYYWNAHLLSYHYYYWDWYWTMNFYRYNYYPWYDYYYAYSPWYWQRRHHFHDWWYFDNKYADKPSTNPKKEKTYRDWGASRGSTTVGDAYDYDRTNSNSPRSRSREDINSSTKNDDVKDKVKSNDNNINKPSTDDRNYRTPSRNTNREVIENNNNSGTWNRSGESSGQSSGRSSGSSSGSSGSSGSTGSSGSSGSSGSGSNSNSERSSTRPR